MTCFAFDRGLFKARQPWTDDADRRRGFAEAAALLLAEWANDRPG
ncbi:hypothetical protein [Qipengyuania flava]|nr:hypothetical protein [Qipengyuania flava]